MAPGGSRSCHSPRQNFFPIDYVEDELARDPGPTNGSHLDNISPAPSHNPTLGSTLIFALIPVPVPTLTSALPFSNELFRQFMKAYLKTNQGPRQLLTGHKQSFKAKIPEVYYGKLYIDCYHFCQQYKDYFEIIGAIGTNQTLFAASFFRGNISVCWA